MNDRSRLSAGVMAVLVVLGASACGGDDNGIDPGSGAGQLEGGGTQRDDGESTEVPGEDGSMPSGPDLNGELATVPDSGGFFELVVNEVRQDGDRVTVWVTITNVSDEPHTIKGSVLGGRDNILRGSAREVDSIYLIDWEASTLYYPMSTDEEDCLCSVLPEPEVPLEPDESLSLFAVYNGVSDLNEATLVVPGFMPADGLSAT